MPDAQVHEGFRPAQSLDHHETVAIAELIQALSTPSRLRLLYALREGEAGVG
jgi:hypothetical protein